MIFDCWMKYIRDDVKLTKVVIPSAHNAGSYGMNWTACCQDGDVYTQYCYGMRHFCLRLDTNKRGDIVMCHGPTKGKLFVDVLRDFARILREKEDFFILDLREYYPQKILIRTRYFRADKAQVDAMLAEYMQPEKYALTDIPDISTLTMGDIRKSGKRYILLNYRTEYDYSVDCEHIIPWEKQVNGDHAKNFVRKTLRFFDDYRTKGLYWFQTQQTPNLGTPIGFRSPRKLDILLRPHFLKLIRGIAENAFYLDSANIISGDFMTEDYMKASAILHLNTLKGNLIPGTEDEYEQGITVTKK